MFLLLEKGGGYIMNEDTRKYINDLANAVITAYHIDIPIKDMEKVAKTIGAVIKYNPNFNDFCDGTIKKTGDRSFEIQLSSSSNSKRNAFTIAHELGHLFLHMGYRTNLEVWKKQSLDKEYQRFGTSNQEYQANEFAGALLMPEKIYKQQLKQHSSNGYVDIGKVANYFNVSVAAATNRGRFLGYLSW